MPPEPLKASFAPLTDTRTRVLVLGSLPGDASLALGQYYGHERNQFWRLIGAAIGRELLAGPEHYKTRCEALRKAGVGLWDVVRTARRRGSLDMHIRDHEAHPLADFAASLPSLKAIAFNGAKAAAIGRKPFAHETRWRLIDLPSSSPANTQPFDRKLAAWLELGPFLTP